MDAHRILETLHSAGLSVELAPGDGLKLTPASRLTDELRQMIRAHKPGLIDWLKAANDDEPVLDLLALDRAYQLHHFKCPTCIAAGQGAGLRCGTGSTLWAAYVSASEGTP